MKWIIAAPYLNTLEKSLWAVAMENNSSLRFILSPANYIHNRSRKQASLRDWQDYWQHSGFAWDKAQQNDCGIITAFPQLAICTGARKRLSIKSTPIVAGTFNLGTMKNGYKKVLANHTLQTINKFIVHSTAEIENYSHYLNLPSNRFVFVPLHKPLMEITEQEQRNEPFILSMGSANRDYRTLFKAIKKTGYPLIVVAPAHSLAGLDIPPSVTIKSSLSLTECRKLVQQARINVVPIDNKYTASGQVTVIEAMMYCRPVIATNTIGTKDYIMDKKTGFLTTPKSATELENTIDTLWNNEKLREDIASRAQEYVKKELNHKKTITRLSKILNEVY